ncbi:MAG: hypothetical protein JW942_05795 [Opitutales bacterium]|nr:hypothetical protein [Opitutales bacterium]
MSDGKAELTVPPEPSDYALIREQAWIGDAVLGLFARRWIVANCPSSADRSDLFRRMTCNQFLTAFGEPTHVEARIGRVYEAHGLAAAFEYMEREILPLFVKQEARRHSGRR